MSGKRRLVDSDKKKWKRLRKFETAPYVSNLEELINIGKELKKFSNIDCYALWNCLPYLEDLNNMIGLSSLKQSIFYQILYYLQGLNSPPHMHIRNEDYLHTVIYGSPGSGKTTVSKIIGKIYQALNILSNNSIFKIASREDFVAEYLGQTAIKTKKLLNSCIGGVLFIDEVYSLAPNNTRDDSFAKEAIDTINLFLSEHKNDFCCIIAGYEEDIESCFFNMNSGLRRRFSWIHKIDEYTNENLCVIFEKMVRDAGWTLNVDKQELLSFFVKNRSSFKNLGGDIETFLTKCKIFHSQRVFCMDPSNKFIIISEDMTRSLEYIQTNMKKKDDGPPYGMYI